MYALAQAQANIALVKYWGKAGAAEENLPSTGSLSLTLAGLSTRTEVSFEESGGPDELLLGGATAPEPVRRRASAFLDQIRARAGLKARARVRSHSTFPIASGLASSASGFAALAAAAARAARLDLSLPDLSALARRGSGSAARSIYGGFVEMSTDGTARPLPASSLEPAMVIALVTRGEKSIGSSEGMRRTAATSPYYAAWTATHAADLDGSRRALAHADLPALGEIMERSCLKMHAAALAADPGILYWRGATVELVAEVRALRARGIAAYFTIDAGPHVKVLCAAIDAETVRAALAAVPGTVEVSVHGPGAGVEILEADA